MMPTYALHECEGCGVTIQTEEHLKPEGWVFLDTLSRAPESLVMVRVHGLWCSAECASDSRPGKGGLREKSGVNKTKLPKV